MKKMLFVGIDISADELVVAVERDGELLPVASFENASTGHRQLIRWLTNGWALGCGRACTLPCPAWG